MKRMDTIEAIIGREEVMQRHFTYVARGPAREFVVPEGRLHEFIMKCLELVDKEDHLERLRLYREQGLRVESSDIDD